MLQLRVSGSQKEDYKQTTKVTSITPCSNAHRTADGVVHAVVPEEPSPAERHPKVAEEVAAKNAAKAVQVPYEYRALQCAARYRSTVYCGVLYAPVALLCS